MRRLLPLLLLSFLFFSVSAQDVEKVYLFDNFKITGTDGYQLISFENTILHGIAGEPTLPYHEVSIPLNTGTAASSMELKFENEIIVPGKYRLYPAQYSIPYSFEGDNPFIKNSKLYNSDIRYPANPEGHLITAFMHGVPVALSSFTPVRYNPATQQLSYFKKVRVIIKSTINNKQSTINNQQAAISNQNNSKSNNYQLLIITGTVFESRFQPLMDLYLTHGMKSQVISTTTISQIMPGQDLQEKIRNYIIQEYQNNNIEYVLLGGDDEVVPHRGFYTTVQSSSQVVNYDIPADIYYSALDGNWNTDNDSLWGEPGEEDLLPEVSVGRLVVSDTNDLNNAFNKIISYQNNPVQGELRDPLLAGEHLYSNPLTWGGDYLDLLIGFHTDNGYTTNGIPTNHNIEKLYDREVGTWPKDTLLAKLNSGKSFLHHVGHANTNTVMRMNTTDITNTNFNSLDGIVHNFLPVYSHGCYSGAFDASDCIAEKMVNINRFALAYIGNARYGWFNEGQTEGPSTHIHREFTNALYSKKINRLGATHLESKIATAPWVTLPGQFEDGALRHCIYSCNVLGDPAMALWTDDLIQVNATYQDSVQALTPMLTVMIDTSGYPMQNFSCAIMKNGNFHGAAISDSLGYAFINIDPPVIDTGEAQLIVSGYNCLPTTFPLYFNDPCPIITVDLGQDTIINPGIVLTLYADSGFASYLWSDGSTGQNYNVSSSGTYWFEGTTAAGCIGRDTISICSGFIISGVLEYNDTMMVSTPLCGVNIQLKDQNKSIITSTLTDSSGYYEFNDLYNGTYFLEEQINIPWGGVNTLDALRVVFHFIGTTPLVGFNLESADVNADGVVNTMDALNIQQRFVGMITSFPAGDWLFERDTLVVGGNSHCIHNYRGLCIGDVDGSYIPSPYSSHTMMQGVLKDSKNKKRKINNDIEIKGLNTNNK